MTIAERLKSIRESKGFTLDYVGKIIGVSRQSLYKYENGIVENIPTDKIEALAQLYQVSPSFLMGWTDTKQKEITPTHSEEKFLKIYREIEKSNDPKDVAILTAINKLLGVDE